METDNLEGFRENPWLMANVYSSIQLTEMLEDDLKFISTFDVSPRAIIVGSDSSTLALIENTKFMWNNIQICVICYVLLLDLIYYFDLEFLNV